MLDKYLLLLCLFFPWSNLVGQKKYNTHSVVIKGIAFNLENQKLITNSVIFSKKEKFPYDFEIEKKKCEYKCSSISSKGEFSIRTFIDKNEKNTWLAIPNFAQFYLTNLEIDTTTNFDTLDLGKVYFVPYDDEMEIEFINVPSEIETAERSRKTNFKKMRINTIDSILNRSDSPYKMSMSSIDTTHNLVTRCSFVNYEQRGTIVRNFKTIYIIQDSANLLEAIEKE